MNNSEILNNLNQLASFDSQYMLFETDNPSVYYGRTQDGLLVFALDSQNKNLPRFLQQTNSLSFCFNEKGVFLIDGVKEERIIHLLVCKDKDAIKEDAFIRLTNAFSMSKQPDDPYYVAKLFAALSSLFDKQHVVSEMELQGLYCELFTILFFQERGCDISRSWQSRDRMKYDFAIGDQKKLEVKSTIKPIRIHHFKHSQLMSITYDIRIVSIMLQKSDAGLSLKDVITSIRDLYQTNYELMLHIDSLVSGIDDAELDQLKYDEAYLRSSIAFYDAREIPHFNELTPEGVFNPEYDSCLSNVEKMEIGEIVSWIEEA